MALTKVDTQLLSNGITTDSTGLNTITNGNLKVLAAVAGTDRKVIFQNELGTQATLAIGTTGSSGGVNTFYIQTNAGYTVNADASGRVTLPYQPSFRVSFNNSAQTTGVIAWNNVHHNIGSYFNTSTYTFTAPVAGRYLFCVMNASARTTSTGDFYIDLELNGTRTNRIYTAPSGGGANIHSQASASAILNMAANDTARVTMQTSPGNVGLLTDQYHNTWSGQLIG